MPAAKIQPPCQMISAAKTAAGTATTTRASRSDVPRLRGSRRAPRAGGRPTYRPPKRRTRAS